MSYIFDIHDIQVFVVLECGTASLGDWHPTFRDSVMVFERRHPMTCRHMQDDGASALLITPTNSDFSLYLNNIRYYIFIYFFCDMATVSLGNGASSMATVHHSLDR
jgi:hypothetical protein